MNGKKPNQAKKLMVTVLAVILILSLVLSMAAPFLSAIAYASPVAHPTTSVGVAQAITEEQSSSNKKPVDFGTDVFQIQGEIGFDNKYILEKQTPFKFIVTNLGADFKGELQLIVHLYDAMDDYSNEYVVYYVPVDLPSNSIKEVTMDVNIFSVRRMFTVSMVDDKGTVMSQQSFSVEAKDPSSVWTGILSENPAELVYLKNDVKEANVDSNQVYGADMYNTVFLTKNSFPANEEVLKNFRMIIINDFNTDVLSDEQVVALKNWVHMGGLLVLGTGVSADKVLGGLDGIAIFNTTSNVGTVLMYDEELVSVTDAEIEGGTVCIDEDIYTSYLHLGKGTVVLHRYDLGKHTIFHSTEFIDYLTSLYNSFNVDRFSIHNSYFFDANTTDYYVLEGISRRSALVVDTTISVIYIIVLVYIFAIGPILYIILKKKDKREKGWVVIPVLAFIITMAVYILGTNSYYRNSIFNSVSYIDAKIGSPIGNADIYGNIASGEKGNLKFTTDADIKMNVANVNSRYHYRYNNTGSEECIMKINATGSPEVTYLGKESWSSNRFTAFKTLDLGGSLEADIKLSESRVTGTITNDTSYDWEDAVLVFGNQVIYVGYIRAGSQVQVLSEIDVEAYSNMGGYYYPQEEALREIFNVNYYHSYGINFFENSEDRRNKYVAYNRYELIRSMIDGSNTSGGMQTQYNEEYMLAGRLFAFNNTEMIIEGDKYLNGKKMNEQQEAMITWEVPLKFDATGIPVIPFGMINPSNVYGGEGHAIDEYSHGYMYSYSDQSFIVEFIVPNNIGFKRFEIEWSSYGYMTLGQIFNFKTNEWEETKFGKYLDVEPYISDEGTILIQGKFDSNEAQVPRISLEGGVQ